jgi:hypothetical protein
MVSSASSGSARKNAYDNESLRLECQPPLSIPFPLLGVAHQPDCRRLVLGICKKQASMGKNIRSHPGFQQLHCNPGLLGASINLDFPQA